MKVSTIKLSKIDMTSIMPPTSPLIMYLCPASMKPRQKEILRINTMLKNMLLISCIFCANLVRKNSPTTKITKTWPILSWLTPSIPNTPDQTQIDPTNPTTGTPNHKDPQYWLRMVETQCLTIMKRASHMLSVTHNKNRGKIQGHMTVWISSVCIKSSKNPTVL